MVLGVGIDLAKIDRIGRSLERFGQRFIDRVYTPAEQAFCADRGQPVRAYALCFAAKEAFSKAIGLGMRGVGWREIEVHHKASGQPYLVLSGRAKVAAGRLGVKASHLSLSDEAGLAAAMVVLEGG